MKTVWTVRSLRSPSVLIFPTINIGLLIRIFTLRSWRDFLYLYMLSWLLLLLQWRDIMTKATYKRKHFTGGLLTVSQGWSMLIMMGGMAVGRLVWHRSSNWETTPYGQGRKKAWDWAWCELLTLQSPPPVTHLLPQSHTSSHKATPLLIKPHLGILPKHSTTGDQVFKHVSLWGSFSFKPPLMY